MGFTAKLLTTNRIATERWFHVTPTDRVKQILREGLLLNSEWAATNGAKRLVQKAYGNRPIFLSKDEPWRVGNGITVLAVNVHGLIMVADIPSFVEACGGFVADDQESVEFADLEDRWIPSEVLKLVDQNGRIRFDSLLNPNSKECRGAIRLTGTSACLQSISANRIRVLHQG